MRSEVEAFINKARVESAGAVSVIALESAVIRADTDAVTSSSGGNVFGKGDSLAVNAVVATNLVLSASSASIDLSDITTSTAGPDGLGDIVVAAQNLSQIDATTRSTAISGANSASFLLAFNTVGYRAQNLLFNTLDALLGVDTFGSEVPAVTTAQVSNSGLHAAGAVSVTGRLLGTDLSPWSPTMLPRRQPLSSAPAV